MPSGTVSRPARITCPAGATIRAETNSPGAAWKCPGAAAHSCTAVRLWQLLPEGWWRAAASILLTLKMRPQRIPTASYNSCCLPAKPILSPCIWHVLHCRHYYADCNANQMQSQKGSAYCASGVYDQAGLRGARASSTVFPWGEGAREPVLVYIYITTCIPSRYIIDASTYIHPPQIYPYIL